jgi:hypothetical protein
MDIAKKHILEYLEEIAIDCNDYEQFYQIAMVSTNYDPELSNYHILYKYLIFRQNCCLGHFRSW